MSRCNINCLHSAKWQARVHRQANALHSHILSLSAEQFLGRPMAVVSAIEEFGKGQSLPMVFRGAKLALARRIVAELPQKPKIVVEFGTFVGCSALAWADIVRNAAGSDPENVHVYTFELDPEMVKISRDLIKLAGVTDIVTVCEGQGSDSLKQLVADGKVKEGRVDMVFIDHWEKFYLPDLKLCEELKLFHKGSIVVADNTDFPGAPEYLAYVKKGGSGEKASVKYESVSHEAEEDSPDSRRPVSALELLNMVNRGWLTLNYQKVVEISTVVEV